MPGLLATIEIVKSKAPPHKPMEGQGISLPHGSVTTKPPCTNHQCGPACRGQKLDRYVISQIFQNRHPGCQSP